MPQAVVNRQLLEQPTSFISVRPLKDVGNGLCTVPLRGNYNLCKQTGTTPDMSFRAKTVSRGIFPSDKFYLVVISRPTWWIPPFRLRYGRNDIMGDVSGFIENSYVLSGAERHIGRSLRFR